MATAKKPAGGATGTRATGTAKTRSPSKTSSKASATAKTPARKGGAKTASKSAAKGAAAKSATKSTAAKSAAKSAGKTAAKGAAKTAGTRGGGAKKAVAKTGTGKRGPNPAFMKPLQPDAQLAAVVGGEPMPRTQVVARVWEYIKKNGLQESRNIRADEKLRPIFGKDQITMFEMMKLVNAHLSDASA